LTVWRILMSANERNSSRILRRLTLLAFTVLALRAAPSAGAGSDVCCKSPCGLNGVTTFANTRSRSPDARGLREVDMLPVHISLSFGVVIGGEATDLDVTVSTVPSGGGSVQILAGGPLASPNGIWPYLVTFPAGSSLTQSFRVTAD